MARAVPKGAGHARNVGLGIACGDYVAFLDADDYFELDFLESMYENASARNSDVCLCGAYNHYCDTGAESKNAAILKTHYLNGLSCFSPHECSRQLFSVTTPAPWSKLYDRSFLLSQGLRFQETRNSNDIFFYVASLSSARSISYVPRCLVHYRIGRTGSLQTENAKRNTGDYARALMASATFLANRSDLAEFRESFSEFATDVITSNSVFPASYTEWLDVYRLVRKTTEELSVVFEKERWPLSEKWASFADGVLACSREEYLYAQLARMLSRCSDLSNRAIIRLENARADAEEKCRAVRDSNSFRIGRAMTWPARAAKRLIK